jgi:hypothetical protein
VLGVLGDSEERVSAAELAMSWLVFAAPAALGLFIGLWRGRVFSALAVAFLTIVAFLILALVQMMPNASVVGVIFYAILGLGACSGGFIGPAIVSRRWLAVVISVIAAPSLTIVLFVAGITLACWLRGACF